MDIKPQDQVISRRVVQSFNGVQATQIRIGTVLAVRENGKALVSFPADRTRAEIEISQLELVKDRTGRTGVNPNPTLRSFSL